MLLLRFPILEAQEIRNGWFCFTLFLLGSFPLLWLLLRLSSSSLVACLFYSFLCVLEEPSSGPLLLFLIQEGSLLFNLISYICARHRWSSCDEQIFKSVQKTIDLRLPNTLMKLLLLKELRLGHPDHTGSSLYFPEESAPRILQLQECMVRGHHTVEFAHAFISTKGQLHKCATTTTTTTGIGRYSFNLSSLKLGAWEK